MRRSLATGGPQGYTRTYLDLLPLFTPELRQLAPRVELPAALCAALGDAACPSHPRAGYAATPDG